MIIKYISCDGLVHEEKIAKMEGCQHLVRPDYYFMRCYRDDSKDDYFDLEIDKLISIIWGKGDE